MCKIVRSQIQQQRALAQYWRSAALFWSDFEAKAMGLPSWIRAAPKPLDDASTCIMDFLDGS